MFKQCQQHLYRFSLSSFSSLPVLSPSLSSSLFFTLFPSSEHIPLSSFVRRVDPSSFHSPLFSLSLFLLGNIPLHSLSVFPCFSLGVACICVTTIMLSLYTRRRAMYTFVWVRVQVEWQYSSTICTQSIPRVDSRYLILESFCVREERLIAG